MTAENLQAEWLEQEKTIRQRMTAGGGKAGLASPDLLTGKNGLQQMQAMLDGAMPYPHIADTMDFALLEVVEGRAVFQGTPQLKHYNPLGSVHGGWYGTLLDSCMGCAVHTVMPVGKAYTTAEYSINIVRAASHQSGPLRAVGTVLHSGRQLATAEGRIVGADGKLYAHATTTCLVFDFPPR
ncbi:MAG: PaaI family thioesterase [Burkholderiaceae bacterium]